MQPQSKAIVDKNAVVALHYVMKTEEGEVLDENMESDPVEYIHGIGKLLPVLETSVAGMAVGERKSFSFSDAQFNGRIDMDVLVKDIRPATTEELASGAPKRACGPEGCC